MHCILVRTDGLLLLRDLGSTNGTRVNGQRVRRAALLPNDQLTIAHFKFRVHLGPDTPVPAAPQILASEHTQALDAREVAHLLKPGARPKPDDAAGFRASPRPLRPDGRPRPSLSGEHRPTVRPVRHRTAAAAVGCAEPPRYSRPAQHPPGDCDFLASRARPSGAAAT